MYSLTSQQVLTPIEKLRSCNQSVIPLDLVSNIWQIYFLYVLLATV